jgi:2,3-bisphosphoglycerate-independent phosphoglycerate mutase
MVATYDLQPEMNSVEVTDHLVDALHSGTYDVIICNYANPDMVGHSGKFDAAVKAIEAVDRALGRIQQALLECGGEMLITADHGNAEQMLDEDTGQPHTAHTSNLVPMIYVGRPAVMAEHGALSDVVPSMMYLMNMEIPPEMTGTSLLTLIPDSDAVDKSASPASADMHG